MRKGPIGVLSIVGATVLNGAAWGQCEVTQLTDGIGSLSISGDVAVVGDSQAFGSLGAVFVYRRGPDGPDDWDLQAILMAPEPDPDDRFGGSVAIGDNVIVVGAHKTDGAEPQSGAAYTYRYDGHEWQYEAMLTASDGDAIDLFGWSVAIDGELVLIGARDDENTGLDKSGSAYVFRYDGGDWVEEAKLTDPNGEELDLFGVSVSIKGDVALVGAHGNSHVWNNSGSAFVFRREGSKWSLEAELADFDSPTVEWFGFSVSLADGVAIIGALRDNSTKQGNDAGSAYIFRYDGAAWFEEQNITASDADPLDWFGASVSISEDGNTVLVGAPNDEQQGFESGSAYLFHYSDGVWIEQAKLVASDGGAGENFGGIVALSNDVALIASFIQTYVFAGMQGIDCNTNGEPDACDIFGGTSDDQDGNGIPDECESIPGDIDGDGSVGASDLLILLTSWGPCENCEDCPADIDGNCVVGASDLLILLVNWG